MTTQTTGRSTPATFDDYWRHQEYSSADPRTEQRAAIAGALLRQTEGRLLDVGCGRGLVAAWFARRGYDVLGIDVSPLAVTWTQRRGVSARLVNLDEDSLAETFDIVLCLETLQYVRDPVAVLTKLRAATAPTGELIVSLPCEYHLVRRVSILLTGRGPGGIDFPLTIFTPREHRRLFERVGFRVSESRPISLVPPRRRLLVRVGQWPVRLAPSLFALSIVYRLVPER